MQWRVTFGKDEDEQMVVVEAEDTVEAASEAWNAAADIGYDPSSATKLSVEPA